MPSPCYYTKLFTLVAILLMGQEAWKPYSSLVAGKKFMRCELTRELLQKYQISKTFLSNWICLVEHESNLDTNKITTTPTGEGHYGLFQISSKDFCRKDRKGGDCNKKCTDFLDNNIDDDVECAKLIFKSIGFKYWRGWNNSCRPQNLPNLELSCNVHSLTARRLVRNNNYG